MPERILVAYASKAGSTHEVAEYIGQTLRETGAEVDVQRAQEVNDVSGYGRVILGSAIRIGQVLPEAVQFVQRHRSALKHLPTAYFVVCMTLAEDTPENRRQVNSWINPLREIIYPVSIGLFAGKLDQSKLDQPSRFLLAFTNEGPLESGDWRNWDSIHTWASALTEETNVLK